MDESDEEVTPGGVELPEAVQNAMYALSTEYRLLILREIMRCPGITADQLRDRTGASMMTVRFTVQELRARGFITHRHTTKSLQALYALPSRINSDLAATVMWLTQDASDPIPAIGTEEG